MSEMKSTIKSKILKILQEEAGEKYPADSLDAQIDSLLLSYDEESSMDMNEGIIKSLKLILEQEEEEGEEEEEEAEEIEISTSEEENVPANEDNVIDMAIFTRNVARLITMYEKLLSVDVTILKRAYNYLESNYGTSKADELRDLLREEYDIELPEEAEKRKEFDFSNRPPADGAGPVGGGA